MADYKHGEMDITTQTETFDGFMNFVTKTTIAILVLVVLMAIFIT
ncbi:aa3-type cytochrome c oxidase subunit IV [Arenibacterium sp. CAU 1754]